MENNQLKCGDYFLISAGDDEQKINYRGPNDEHEILNIHCINF